jgi:hypothetical protein
MAKRGGRDNWLFDCHAKHCEVRVVAGSGFGCSRLGLTFEVRGKVRLAALCPLD